MDGRPNFVQTTREFFSLQWNVLGGARVMIEAVVAGIILGRYCIILNTAGRLGVDTQIGIVVL